MGNPVSQIVDIAQFAKYITVVKSKTLADLPIATTLSKKLYSFLDPARSFCVIGLERLRFGVWAMMSRLQPYCFLRFISFIMKSPASTPLSEELQR